MMELYMDAAVVVGHDIYFTTGNTSCLYKLSHGKIEVETVLPMEEASLKKFASLIYYQSQIWMIPWNESYIWLYHLKTKKVRHFSIPSGIRNVSESSAFRRAVQVGQYIWTIPNYSDCLFRIDMEQETYQRYNSWPKGVLIEKDQPNFKSISYDAGKLYLFRDVCSENLVVDVNDGSMEVWNIPAKGEFGVVKNKKAYIAPVHTNDTLRIYDVKNTEVELRKEIVLPENVWAKECLYAFWHTDAVADRIFVMPNEANGILAVDILSDKLSCIPAPSSHYQTIRRMKNFSGYETIAYEEKILIIPYYGNIIYAIDPGNKISEFMHLQIETQSLAGELEAFIDDMDLTMVDTWKNEEAVKCTEEKKYVSVGETIWRLVR